MRGRPFRAKGGSDAYSRRGNVAIDEPFAVSSQRSVRPNIPWLSTIHCGIDTGRPSMVRANLRAGIGFPNRKP
jgi:hypothetical protein